MPQSNIVNVSELKTGMEIVQPVLAKNDSGRILMLIREYTRVDTRIINILKMHKIKTVRAVNTGVITRDTSPRRENDPIISESEADDSIIEIDEPSPDTWISRQRPDVVLPKSEIQPIINEELYEEAVFSIRSIFDAIQGNSNLTTAYQAVNEFESVLDQLIEAATQDVNGLIHINDLKSYDEYTYHHSLSVALLSVATGQALGLEHEKLKKLGRSAMLHDVGKQFIPSDILNNKGRLTEEQFNIMRDHPGKGALSLKLKSLGDPEIWSGVMFHHEKLNGTGYPRGLKNNEIPLFAKIIAVTDVYDAVTSYRSYRSPMPPAEAYEIICSQVETAFDYDIVKAFFKRLELYPIGTVLELNDGRIATVVENDIALRPVIMLKTGEKIDLASLKNLTLTINKIFNPHEQRIQ